MMGTVQLHWCSSASVAGNLKRRTISRLVCCCPPELGSSRPWRAERSRVGSRALPLPPCAEGAEVLVPLSPLSTVSYLHERARHGTLSCGEGAVR